MKAIDLDCGIAPARIASWLDAELGLSCDDGSGIYRVAGRACTVELAALEPRVLGTVSIERTRLRAWGDREAVESFEKLFTLRFMSAGG